MQPDINRLPILEHLITYPRTFCLLRLPILEHFADSPNIKKTSLSVYRQGRPPTNPTYHQIKNNVPG